MYQRPSRASAVGAGASARPARTFRRRQSGQRLSGTRLAACGLVVSLALGCSLSDYYVDPDYGSGGSGGGTSGGASAAGGKIGKEEGGKGGLGGVGGLGGTASQGGAAGKGGSGGCGSCAGTCCGTECVDVLTDPKHCGACNSTCSVGRACKAGACESGWVPSALPPSSFDSRERAAFASMGDKIFIWGGLDDGGGPRNDGAIYDPVNDTWTLISTDAATLSPRHLATAVWTGSAVLVFGGQNAAGNTYYRDAALYNPVTDSWSAVPAAVTPRSAPNAWATPSTVVFFGGLTTGGGGGQGASQYDIATNTWTPTASLSAPMPGLGIAQGFSGNSLYIYGGMRGIQRSNLSYRYDVGADTWTALANGPGERAYVFGVGDGSSFFVWGGRDNTTVRADGAVFTNAWTSLATAGAPSARTVLPRQAGWSFALETGVVAFLGGVNGSGATLKDGGVYDVTNGWSAIQPWPSGEDHQWAVVARAGGELFVWSGSSNADCTTTGERWIR